MSLISEAIAEITGNHRLDQTTDHCKARGSCKLRSGHEVTFVSLIADRLFRAIEERQGRNLEYHQWVYMPSRRAERDVGYDLSLGKYDDESKRRIRSMHKLLLGWCDSRRFWSLNPGSRDHKHLEALIKDHRASEAVRPYLVVHICYCIHEYRRMGLEHQGFNIPGVGSLLRTLVISLADLSVEAEHLGVPLDRISLQYRRNTNRRLPGEARQAYLDRIAAPDNHLVTVKIDGERWIKLPILSLTQWQDETVNFLLGDAES